MDIRIQVDDIYTELGKHVMTIKAHQQYEAKLEEQIRLLQKKLEPPEEPTADGE